MVKDREREREWELETGNWWELGTGKGLLGNLNWGCRGVALAMAALQSCNSVSLMLTTQRRN